MSSQESLKGFQMSPKSFQTGLIIITLTLSDFLNIFRYFSIREGFFFIIRARKRKLQTETDILVPILPRTPPKNAPKFPSPCLFQLFQRHPTFSITSPDFSQPSPPPKRRSRSEVSDSSSISPKYKFQYQKVPMFVKNASKSHVIIIIPVQGLSGASRL